MTQSDFGPQQWHPSDTDVAGLLGFGVSYPVTDRMSVGLEWSRTYSTRFHDGADDRIVFNDGESRLLSLGVRWNF
jgi:opacity protein-like surface antigen